MVVGMLAQVSLYPKTGPSADELRKLKEVSPRALDVTLDTIAELTAGPRENRAIAAKKVDVADGIARRESRDKLVSAMVALAILTAGTLSSIFALDDDGARAAVLITTLLCSAFTLRLNFSVSGKHKDSELDVRSGDATKRDD